MKRLHVPSLFQTSWQILSTATILVATIGLLLFHQLDVLLPGYSMAELETAAASSSLNAIVSDPVHAPYKLVVFAISQVSENPLLATRLASGLFGVFTVALFYFGIRRWHSSRVAFLSSALFVTAGWFLFTARLGTPDIMFPFTILLFVTIAYWIAEGGKSKLGYFLAMLALGLSIYVPGIIWLLLLGLLVRRTKDFRILGQTLSWIGVSLLVLGLLLLIAVPITYAIVQQPSAILPLLGVPETLPTLLDYAKNLVFVPLSLLVLAGAETEFWIGRLPLLDIFSSMLFVLGLYYYFKYRSLDRAKLLVGYLIVASALVALDGPITIALLLPATYVIIAGGIAFLLAQWKTVFPLNPVAQTFAIVLLSLAITTSVIYNLRAYFVAWPNSERTKSTYSQQESDLLQ